MQEQIENQESKLTTEKKEMPKVERPMFKEGMIISIAGVKFRIQSLRPKKMILKLVNE